MTGKNLKFFELVKDQFVYGAKKYGIHGKQTRESTDILCDDFGVQGLLWTIGKYHLRYETQKREKDLLKIACYIYLLWLKFGYYLTPEGTDYLNDTGIEQKEDFWSVFRYHIDTNIDIPDVDIKTSYKNLIRISWIDNDFSAERRKRKQLLYQMFHIIRELWIKEFGDNKEHDTDTENKRGKNG